MSIMKDIMADQETKKNRKIKGYRDKLFAEGTYNMPCPACCNPLSNDDVKKEQCIHCGYIFKW